MNTYISNIDKININLIGQTGDCDAKNYIFCGSTNKDREGVTYEKFKQKLGFQPLNHNFYCVCGHRTYKNFWIYHEKSKKVICLGSACFKKFGQDTLKLKCYNCKIVEIKDGNILCKKCLDKEENVIKDEEEKVIKKYKKECKKCDVCNRKLKNEGTLCEICFDLGMKKITYPGLYKDKGLYFLTVFYKDVDYFKYIVDNYDDYYLNMFIKRMRIYINKESIFSGN
jgi:hypothetical protein